MEMCLKRSTLVFLTALAALVISGQAPVILDNTKNRRVEVPVGSSVTFQCGLTTEKFERFRVVWHFNPSGSSIYNSSKLSSEIFNKSEKTFSVVSNETTLKNTEDTSLKYTLSNATVQNSGWYFCKVISEIPLYTLSSSIGREVVITKSKENTTYPSLPIVTATVTPTNNFQLIDWWMWLLLGVAVFILIVLLVICVWLRRRRHRSRVEQPIYANTHRVPNKQPSPRPGTPAANNLKLVSSSQNLRTPSPGRKYEDKRRYKH
ncbi:uncharacterized protein LOC119488202 isoform X1 [Sebastes umbrosus]|uniref:uncharacterized protein LOC119488202 isoform X1 n=1 Tax=Sebastes umbrosus TaxID=72105 RepID=UPI00189EE8BB|nr:uncharacterized protein LOC119488202 isoform X1 [Sebastes umbrosus]